MEDEKRRDFHEKIFLLEHPPVAIRLCELSKRWKDKSRAALQALTLLCGPSVLLSYYARKTYSSIEVCFIHLCPLSHQRAQGDHSPCSIVKCIFYALTEVLSLFRILCNGTYRMHIACPIQHYVNSLKHSEGYVYHTL
jgi:hypothetical protein